MDASTRPARGPRGHGELHETWRISAWKTYTQYGPNGEGYFLHDDVGIRFIEKARALGVKNIRIHKGLPFGPRSYEHSQCSDIGVVAPCATRSRRSAWPI